MVEFHTRSWDPRRLFSGLRAEDFPSDGAVLAERRDHLWQASCAEFDASELHKEVDRRGLLLSQEARQYIDIWGSDERRHADGFIILSELVGGVPEAETRRALAARPHDFSIVNRFVEDEFSLLAIIAFDEIATCHSYARDKEFYLSLEQPIFLRWLREVIADEVTHATNAMRVIHSVHSHRVPEIKDLLTAWTKAGEDYTDYRGTFLMDSLNLGYSRSDLGGFVNNVLKLSENKDMLFRGGKHVAW